MELVKIFLIASLASLIPGQLLRFPVQSESGAVTLTDVLVFLTIIFFWIYSFIIKKTLKVPLKIFWPFLLFSLSALSSTVLASNNFSQTQIFISLLFLLRFIAYFLMAIVVVNIIQKHQIQRSVNLFLFIGFTFIILGIIQLLVFPDFSPLVPFGWDPHQKRIATSLLDPNFSGLIFTMIVAFSTSLYLYNKKNIYLVLSLFSLTAIVFTFSRSSYLAVLIVILTIAVLKSSKMAMAILTMFVFIALLVPQVRTRVVGALTFDETARARLESWQKSISIFKSSPVFGVGFNTYRFAQAKYGFFSADNPFGGHSGAGSDSSVLLVAATTGISGLIFYILLLTSIFQTFKRFANKSYLHLASLSSFLGLIVHSQFVNSLFFPQIMLLLFFFLGLTLVNDS